MNFLIDECVNQKAVQSTNPSKKGFDIKLPVHFTFKQAEDTLLAKLAKREGRVLVTADSDFQRELRYQPGDVPAGILWFHTTERSSKKGMHNLLEKFCRYRREFFAHRPYDFTNQIIEVNEKGMTISDLAYEVSFPWPSNYFGPEPPPEPTLPRREISFED